MISDKDRRLIDRMRRTRKFFGPALAVFWMLVVAVQVHKMRLALAAVASHGIKTASEAWAIATTRPPAPPGLGPPGVYLIDTAYSVLFWMFLAGFLTIYIYTYLRIARLVERLATELEPRSPSQ